MSDKLKHTAELAALLDGEVRDPARVEELNALLASDSALKTEYEDQRSVKSLMAGLADYPAPDFMATRVMGEISARRNQRTVSRLRVWLSAATGFAACMLLVVVFNQFGGQQTPQSETAFRAPEETAAFEHGGAVGDLAEFMPAADPNDPMTDFLRFAHENHQYSVLENSLGSMTPNMPEAILVLEGNHAYRYVLSDAAADGAASDESDESDEPVRLDEEGNPITLNLTEAGGN